MKIKVSLLYLIITLISNNIHSQETVFNYEIHYLLTYQPDSTNKNSRKTENMVLFAKKEKSLFLSYNQFLYDSAFASQSKLGNTFGPPITFATNVKTSFKYHIFKTGDLYITFDKLDLITSPYFTYSEPACKLDWKILTDRKKIGSLNCQKATCNFGDREWIAWFSSEIPLNIGPYKFCGLPGLIIEISDSQQYWNFNFESFERKDNVNYAFGGEKAQKLEKKDFFKKLRESYDNGFELEQADGSVYYTDEKNQNHFRKVAEERAKAANNWIELYNNKN